MNYLWSAFYYLQTGELRFPGGWRVFTDATSGNFVVAHGQKRVLEASPSGDVSIGGSLAQGA